MTKEWYLEFRRDHTRDMMELYYEYYKLKGGSLSSERFNNYFSRWLLIMQNGLHRVQHFVFRELNEHFLV